MLRSLRLCLGLAAALCVPGCGAGNEPARPAQAFAHSSAAQREYRALRARWFATKPGQRAGLASDINNFVRRYPFDQRALSAGLFLAWIHLDNNEVERARAFVGSARKGSRQADYARITEAAVLTRAGQPERALAVLDPLAGKIVDPDERLVHGEERVRAALAARRFEHSVHAMLDWLLQAPVDRYDEVRRDVRVLLSRVPTSDLLRALQALHVALSGEARSADIAAVRNWLRKTEFAELSKRAIEAGDATLARSLLPLAPPASRASSEFAALSRLAAAGSAAPRIAGRAVGLFLSLGSDDARRRSAALAAGVVRGLQGLRPAVELVIKDDTGSPERITSALSGLAGDGAAIIIAGADEETATHAAVFAERARIPVLLVGKPRGEEQRDYGFQLQVDEETSAALLNEALAARGKRSIVRLGSGGLSCSPPASFAGQPRFAVEVWRKERVDGLIVLGDASCVRDVTLEVRAARVPALIACGLECAERAIVGGGPDVALRAGRFPRAAEGAPSTWYEALGRDAAALSGAALADFPDERVIGRAEVGELHERARRALERVEVELETSAARGFAGGRVLPRTLAVIDGAAEPGLKGKP